MSADALAHEAVPVDREKLGAARLWSCGPRGMPYFAHAVFALIPVGSLMVPTLGVDRYWRLYCNPHFVDACTVAELGSVLVHEICHLLRDHAGRADDLAIGVRDRVSWNICADAEINDDLRGLELPAGGVFPGDIGQPAGRLAEQYYRDLPRAEGRSDLIGEHADTDCGSCAGGGPREWELPSDDGSVGGLSATAGDLVRRAVANEIRTSSPGTAPESWKRWAVGVLEPAVDWRAVLSGAVRNAIANVAGQVDYSYSRPSRRAHPQGIIMPALRRPIPVVAVVIDTSASMSGDALSHCLAEVHGILEKSGCVPGSVSVIAADTAAAPAQRVWSASEVELVGGGGTDMRVGIAAAAALRPRPDVCVVLSDGETPWPDSPTPFRLVVGLVGASVVSSGTPPWATVVEIPAD